MMDEKELQEIEERANKATPGDWTKGAGPKEIREAHQHYHQDIDLFIHCHQDIPALIAEIRRLQEELTALHASFAEANERKYNRLPQPPEMEGTK
jgi:hypothetical protein